ncbi:MAG TPA: choice-of-anchor tandem repeat GloVer-containing protein [Rhizomicrobium sp.]|nr:choice-of-anchor tandem repeat GloVer-containing protein [Rhizomicrobium sp.]
MSRIAIAWMGLSAALIALTASPASAATEHVLWSFKKPDRGYPLGRLLVRGDALYGMDSAFGDGGNGAVFALHQADNAWTEKTLVKFDGTNGSEPFAGLMTSSGTLYGTTAYGGSYNCGIVFSARKQKGSWRHHTLWSFGKDSSDGCNPTADLVMDSSGNIFGTTTGGGGGGGNCGGGCGTVFELSPQVGRGWSETVLHVFEDGSDGAAPRAGLFLDRQRNLFGTTSAGGGRNCLVGCGVVYEVSPDGGKWSFNTIHTFEGNDGGMPWGVLIAGPKGTLYGTTTTGGTFGYGAVYSLAPSNGNWTEHVLYSFQNLDDGGTPQAALTRSEGGVLYGTAFSGGQSGCTENVGCGVVFQLTQTKGAWTESVLYAFSGGSDGGNPAAAVNLDGAGNLYSTSYAGGAYGNGTVWEVTP